MKIWKCPSCDSGVRAPQSLSRDDVRRWCLGCSKKTGKLVERTIPSRDAEKAKRAAARKVATEKRQERRAVAEAATKQQMRDYATTFDRPMLEAADWLRAWAPRIARLKTFREAARENAGARQIGARWSPTIRIRQGRRPRYASGRAWPWTHGLVMTTGSDAADDLSTLIHELAHLAAPDDEWHGPVFQLIQRTAIRELTGDNGPLEINGRRMGELGRVAMIQRWLDSQKGTTP